MLFPTEKRFVATNRKLIVVIDADEDVERCGQCEWRDIVGFRCRLFPGQATDPLGMPLERARVAAVNGDDVPRRRCDPCLAAEAKALRLYGVGRKEEEEWDMQ